MNRPAHHNGTPHPMAHLAAKEKARLSAILADIRARDRLDGPAVHLDVTTADWRYLFAGGMCALVVGIAIAWVQSW